MIRSALAALCLLALCAPASAGVITFTDQASFQAATAPGGYFNDFSSLTPDTSYGNLQPFSNGTYSYNVTAPFDLFSGQAGFPFISTQQNSDVMTITFTGAAVTAVGMNTFSTDKLNGVDGGPITVTLASGESHTFPTTDAATFVGFTSDASIVSLSFESTGHYAAVTNLYVGATATTAIPEPSSLAMAATASALALAAFRRRRSSGR